MKKFKIISKIIVFLIVGVSLFVFFIQSPSKDDTSQYDRYNNANSDQKACVKTLGGGVYKDKSLEWTLDSCNVPK